MLILDGEMKDLRQMVSYIIRRWRKEGYIPLYVKVSKDKKAAYRIQALKEMASFYA